MKRYERIAALVFMMVGVAAAIYSVVSLKLGTLRRPDSGFLPFLASLTMVISSLVWYWTSREPNEKARPFWEKDDWRRPTLAVAMLIFYAGTMTTLGYLLSTLLFLLAWQFLVERERWVKATLVSVLGTAGMYLLFARLLSIQVPPGIFGR